MELFNLNAYVIPNVTIACLVVGFCLKPLNFIPNKAIPLCLAVLGLAVSVFANGGFTLDIAIGGMLSGLLSTGLYEAFANYLKKTPTLFDAEADTRDDIEVKEGEEDDEE